MFDGVYAVWEGREYIYARGSDLSVDMNSNTATRAACGRPKLYA